MSKTMMRRIDSGPMLEKIVYNVPDRIRNPGAYDPEHQKRDRFQTAEEYEKHKINISRRKHLRYFQENFGPTSYYSTLTFDDAHEVHTFEEARRIRNNIRRVLQRVNKDAVFFIYMGRGKTTNRIHFHMVSEGLPPEEIKQKWKYGTIKKVVRLRDRTTCDGVDHGQDYTGLANYCFGHWTEEVGGHHWMMTSNAKKPQYDDPEETTADYTESNPPEAPEGYLLTEVETSKYGYKRFKFMYVGGQKERKPIKVRVRVKRKRYRGNTG